MTTPTCARKDGPACLVTASRGARSGRLCASTSIRADCGGGAGVACGGGDDNGAAAAELAAGRETDGIPADERLTDAEGGAAVGRQYMSCGAAPLGAEASVTDERICGAGALGGGDGGVRFSVAGGEACRFQPPDPSDSPLMKAVGPTI